MWPASHARTHQPVTSPDPPSDRKTHAIMYAVLFVCARGCACVHACIWLREEGKLCVSSWEWACPCSGPFVLLIRMHTVVNICVNLPPCGASVYTGVLQWLGMLCRDVWRYLQHCGKINRIIQRLNNFYCCTKKKPYVSQHLMCVYVFFTAGMLFFFVRTSGRGNDVYIFKDIHRSHMYFIYGMHV